MWITLLLISGRHKKHLEKSLGSYKLLMVCLIPVERNLRLGEEGFFIFFFVRYL
jgi:hypothetical protein